MEISVTTLALALGFGVTSGIIIGIFIEVEAVRNFIKGFIS